jgi:hypothetical protein
MARFKSFVTVAIVLALALGTSASVLGQSDVTSADIRKIQDNLDQAERDISQLKARDRALATQLEAELDDVRDETVYLRVKARKNEPIARSEYADLRDKIEHIRDRARGNTGSHSSRSGGAASRSESGSEHPWEVPAGTEFDVRLERTLSSATAQVEDRFEATTAVDLRKDERVLIPTGSVLRGVVSSVNKAGRLERKGALTVTFDRLTIDGRSFPIQGTVTQAIESEGIKGEVAKIGAGAGVGAIIGGILGGAKGALAGILIGGGGTIAATEGKDVELPPGTVLRVRLDAPVDVRR